MNTACKMLANALQDLSAISIESKYYDRSLYTYLNLHNSFQLERFGVVIFILTSLSVIGFLNLKVSYKIFGVVKILYQHELYFSRYLFLLSCSLLFILPDALVLYLFHFLCIIPVVYILFSLKLLPKFFHLYYFKGKKKKKNVSWGYTLEMKIKCSSQYYAEKVFRILLHLAGGNIPLIHVS